MLAKQVLALAVASAYPITASPLNNTFHRLTKRANPQFINFPPGSEDMTKLFTGTNDAFVLAATAQVFRRTYPDLWDLYFPTSQQDAAERVFNRIVPDVTDALNGGDTIAEFRFDAVDWLLGQPGDICSGGGEAYTSNLQGQATEFARCHVCAKTLDDLDEEEPLFLTGLECDDFFDEDDNKYHVTREMNVLGATILHEMTHHNGVSRAAYDVSDPNVGDLGNMDPNQQANYDQGNALVWDETDTGSEVARELTVRQPLKSIKNAENYVWLALESYWTFECQGKLSERGQTRFEPPDAGD